MKGQFTGLEVAADQQAVPRGGGSQPRPGIPALALGTLPGGADLGCLRASSWLAASAQVNLLPLARVRRKVRGTRST